MFSYTYLIKYPLKFLTCFSIKHFKIFHTIKICMFKFIIYCKPRCIICWIYFTFKYYFHFHITTSLKLSFYMYLLI